MGRRGPPPGRERPCFDGMESERDGTSPDIVSEPLSGPVFRMNSAKSLVEDHSARPSRATGAPDRDVLGGRRGREIDNAGLRPFPSLGATVRVDLASEGGG